MKKSRILLALIVTAVMLICGCGGAASDNGVPADSVISQSAAATGSSDVTDSIPGDSTVTAAVESSVLAAPEKRNVPVIYLIIPTETGLSAQMEDIILKGARRAGYDVIVKTHNGAAEKQSKAFEEAVSDKACAVICDNIAGEGIKSDTQIARSAGIPVFLVNRGVPDEGVCEGQVRTDRNSAMISLAQIFARHHRLRETYALIYNANSSFENLYAASFRRGLNDFSGMKEAAEAGLVDLDSENVQSVIRSVLNSNSSVDTFVCGNGEEALAVIEALKALEIEKEVICLDGDNDRLTVSVSEGSVYAAVVKPARELAEKILEVVLSYLQNGETQTETAYVPGVVISNDEPASLDDINREIAIETAPTPTPKPSYNYDEDDNNDNNYSYNYNDNHDYDDYDYDNYDDNDYDDGGSGSDSGNTESGSGNSSDGNDSGSGSDSGSGNDSGSGSDSGSGGSSEGEASGGSDGVDTVSMNDGGAETGN